MGGEEKVTIRNKKITNRAAPSASLRLKLEEEAAKGYSQLRCSLARGEFLWG